MEVQLAQKEASHVSKCQWMVSKQHPHRKKVTKLGWLLNRCIRRASFTGPPLLMHTQATRVWCHRPR